MKSNGKSVRWDGTPVTTDTGEIFWGEPGTNGQHAFYQLIHQGTRLIPADFIAVADPAHPAEDGGADVHELFLSNYLAQTAALAFGKTADEVRAEGTAEEIVPARVFSGNRPTTSILAPALTPSVVGQLIALYEHITFTNYFMEVAKMRAARMLWAWSTGTTSPRTSPSPCPRPSTPSDRRWFPRKNPGFPYFPNRRYAGKTKA